MSKNKHIRRIIAKEYATKRRLLKEAANKELDTNFVYKEAVKEFVKEVRALPDTLSVIPNSLLNTIIAKASTKAVNLLKIKYKRLLLEQFNSWIKLGTKHTVIEILNSTLPFRKTLKSKVTFSSMLGDSLSDLIEEPTIAEFSREDELTPEQRKILGIYKRNLTILSKNVDTLKRSGFLYRGFPPDRYGHLGRQSIEERLRFLQQVGQIDDAVVRAETVRKEFPKLNYFQNRLRVLTSEYGSDVDSQIKQDIGNYFSKNIEGLRQIKNRAIDARATTFDLEDKLTAEIIRERIIDINPRDKAIRIIQTEVSIAYNFGKLAGFTSPKDLRREFKWNNDTEANAIICDACLALAESNTIKTAGEIITLGTRVDRGIMNYAGRTRTDFKNPALAVIPYHPNCNCYWELLPYDNLFDELLEEEASKTHKNFYSEELPPGKLISKDVGVSTTKLAIAGGLLVGGAFLLSRSNMWASLFKLIKDTEFPEKDIVDRVIDVGKYINNNYEEPIKETFDYVLNNVVTTNPNFIP